MHDAQDEPRGPPPPPEMEDRFDHSEAIRRLQRCINDLVSLLALPASWGGSESVRIANTLADALLGMLHLDLVYLRLNEPSAGSFIEIVRSALEVLDGQQSLYSAELTLAEAHGNEYRSLIQLYKALGGGWQLEANTQTAQAGHP